MIAFFSGSLSIHVLMVLQCSTGLISRQNSGCSYRASSHERQTRPNTKRSEVEKYQKK